MLASSNSRYLVSGVVRGDVYKEAVPLKLYKREQIAYLGSTLFLSVNPRSTTSGFDAPE
jgi:hypothetical protein